MVKIEIYFITCGIRYLPADHEVKLVVCELFHGSMTMWYCCISVHLWHSKEVALIFVTCFAKQDVLVGSAIGLERSNNRLSQTMKGIEYSNQIWKLAQYSQCGFTFISCFNNALSLGWGDSKKQYAIFNLAPRIASLGKMSTLSFEVVGIYVVVRK